MTRLDPQNANANMNPNKALEVPGLLDLTSEQAKKTNGGAWSSFWRSQGAKSYDRFHPLRRYYSR